MWNSRPRLFLSRRGRLLYIPASGDNHFCRGLHLVSGGGWVGGGFLGIGHRSRAPTFLLRMAGGIPALPRGQVINYVNIAGEQGRQSQQVSTAVHRDDPENELGSHQADKQTQEEAENISHKVRRTRDLFLVAERRLFPPSPSPSPPMEERIKNEPFWYSR